MKWLTKPEVEAFLRANGVSSVDQIEAVLSGFDFNVPIYYQLYEEDQELFQFIRNPSAVNLSPRVGCWFALPGATTQGVAIIDGGSGRRFHRFRVVRAFTAIEGTAKSIPIMWQHEVGGPGGATQIYVHPNLIGHLTVVSPAERR